MNRRNFLTRMTQMGAAASASNFMWIPAARGQGPAEQFFVFVAAQGGWDQTHICDPKGNTVFYDDSRGPLNNYAPEEIRQVGNIRYSPMPPNANEEDRALDWLDTFFQTHYERLTVLNGISISTNSHQTGTRVAARGTGSMALPNFGAMYANLFGGDVPMPFMGGFQYGNNSMGLTSQTSFGVFDRLRELAAGNEVHTRDDVLPEDVFNRLQEFAAAELDRRHYIEDEAAEQFAMEQLRAARGSMGDLDRTLEYLPTEMSRGFRGTMERIAAGFASGNSVFAAASQGGFDNHGNIDVSFGRRINSHLDAIDHLWNELERHGIADRTNVILTSDLGRTPWYNDSDGKDHWSVASYMVMSERVPGNRVIGATNHQLRDRKIDPMTLEIDDENGIDFTAAAVHQALRRLAGIEGTFLDYAYNLNAPSLDLFA